MKSQHTETINKALEFEKAKNPITSTSERVIVSREAKKHILALNEIYKVTKDVELMEIMKRLTAIKQRAEKRLIMRV